MNPREILGVAQRLSEGTSAASYRSAISRAYYYAFNVASEFLAEMRFERGGGKDLHRRIHGWLGDSSDQAIVDAGTFLSSLCTDRNRADYEMDRTSVDSKNAADKAVRMAKEIVASIDAVEKETSRWHSIKNTIMQKERNRTPQTPGPS